MEDGPDPVNSVVSLQRVATQRSSSEKISPARLPGQRILEDWSGSFKLFPLHVH